MGPEEIVLKRVHCGSQLTSVEEHKNTGKWAEKKMLLLPLPLSKGGLYKLPLNLWILTGKVLSEAKAFLSRPCFSDCPKESNLLAKQKKTLNPHISSTSCLTQMAGIFTRTEFGLQPSQLLSLVLQSHYHGKWLAFTMANE